MFVLVYGKYVLVYLNIDWWWIWSLFIAVSSENQSEYPIRKFILYTFNKMPFLEHYLKLFLELLEVFM